MTSIDDGDSTPSSTSDTLTHTLKKKKKQILVRKLVDLKSQLDDARSLAAAAEDARRAAEGAVEEMREERDNARAALSAHVAELVERGEELAGLRSAVEELTRALGGEQEEEEEEEEREGGEGEEARTASARLRARAPTTTTATTTTTVTVASLQRPGGTRGPRPGTRGWRGTSPAWRRRSSPPR